LMSALNLVRRLFAISSDDGVGISSLGRLVCRIEKLWVRLCAMLEDASGMQVSVGGGHEETR
jgi:hypothetical protein